MQASLCSSSIARTKLLNSDLKLLCAKVPTFKGQHLFGTRSPRNCKQAMSLLRTLVFLGSSRTLQSLSIMYNSRLDVLCERRRLSTANLFSVWSPRVCKSFQYTSFSVLQSDLHCLGTKDSQGSPFFIRRARAHSLLPNPVLNFG